MLAFRLPKDSLLSRKFHNILDQDNHHHKQIVQFLFDINHSIDILDSGMLVEVSDKSLLCNILNNHSQIGMFLNRILSLNNKFLQVLSMFVVLHHKNMHLCPCLLLLLRR